MLVIGARGFAKQLLDTLEQLKQTENLVFYDDVNYIGETMLYNRFEIINNIKEAESYFKNTINHFALGIGNPVLRKIICEKFSLIGGELTTIISPKSTIGIYDSLIGVGSNILTGAVLESGVKIGKGCLINLNCTIAHDTQIGEFCEISPGVNISGDCVIGPYTFIGTNATILPKIKIGTNVIVAAGSVITNDIPDDSMVAGVPGLIKKINPSLSFLL